MTISQRTKTQHCRCNHCRNKNLVSWAQLSFQCCTSQRTVGRERWLPEQLLNIRNWRNSLWSLAWWSSSMSSASCSCKSSLWQSQRQGQKVLAQQQKEQLAQQLKEQFDHLAGKKQLQETTHEAVVWGWRVDWHSQWRSHGDQRSNIQATGASLRIYKWARHLCGPGISEERIAGGVADSTLNMGYWEGVDK